jgi:DnaK suppressor protein
MDPERARELLARERRRIERALAGNEEGADERSDTEDSADAAAELFETGLEEGIAEHLRDDLEAIGRAEERLDAGQYGLSIESGEPIPDARLELIPWAERTAAEQERWERGG